MDVAVRRRLRVAARDESGFTLVEVMVACLILMILASGVFGILSTTLKSTRDDKNRVAASGLAARELEIVRQQFYAVSPSGTYDNVNAVIAETNVWNPDQLPGGVANGPLVVGGTPYTVHLQVTPQLKGPGASACDGGSTVAHPAYQATVTVTWDNMGLTRPVTNTTILTPPKNVVDDTASGYLAIKVTGADTQPSVNRVVQVVGPGGNVTAYTDAAGCAVARLSAAGTYTATLGDPGYVDYYGNATPSVQENVTLGQLQVHAAPIRYDRAGTLNVTISAPTGYGLPAQLPYLSLGNSQITSSNVGTARTGVINVPTTGPTTSVTGLWPFTDGYAVWAGSCTDADPALPPTNGTEAAPVVIAPGGTQSAQVTLTPVDVTAVDGNGNPLAGLTVWATKPSGTTGGCQADAAIQLGQTDATGNLLTSLPNGNWQVSDMQDATAAGAHVGSPFTVTGSATTTQLTVS